MSLILSQEHHVPYNVATMVTQTFLHNFRLCPDNNEVSLDKWRCLLWSNALGEQYATLAKEVYQRWLQLRYHFLALSPEVIALLLQLRQHYLLSLITNGPSSSQWEKIHRLGIKPYFDCILVSGDLAWEKPHEGIFLDACKYLGVEPKHCIMVGDKLETDILGGKEASLGGTVWIPLCKEHPDLAEDDPCPDFTLENVTDLPFLLPSKSKSTAIIRSSAAYSSPFLNPRNRRLVDLPDLEDCNSNSSDGS